METFQDCGLRGLEFDTCDVEQTSTFMGLVLQVVLYGALLSESVVLFKNSSKMERLNQVDSLVDSNTLLRVINVRQMFPWFKHACVLRAGLNLADTNIGLALKALKAQLFHCC